MFQKMSLCGTGLALESSKISVVQTRGEEEPSVKTKDAQNKWVSGSGPHGNDHEAEDSLHSPLRNHCVCWLNRKRVSWSVCVHLISKYVQQHSHRLWNIINLYSFGLVFEIQSCFAKQKWPRQQRQQNAYNGSVNVQEPMPNVAKYIPKENLYIFNVISEKDYPEKYTIMWKLLKIAENWLMMKMIDQDFS